MGAAEARCFAVRRGEVTHRLDCQFHFPEHYAREMRLRNSGFLVHRVGDPEVSRSIVDGPFGSQLKVEEYQPSGIPLLRVSNCRTGEVLTDDELVYISEEKHQQLIRSEVLPGDVLLTKAGHILGYTAVFPKALVRGNITSHLASIRPSDGLLPEFLAVYLSSSLGIEQIYRWGNKTTRPELNTDEVRQILIPVPPLGVQRVLVAEMKAAREARRRKLAQARTLLTSLDGLVLERLGLVVEETPQRGPFAVRLGEARQRCDVDYHSPRFHKLRRSITQGQHPVTTIGAVCERMNTGFAAGREAQAFDDVQGIPHVRPLNISPFGELHFEGTKYVPRDSVAPADLLTKGEVLFNNTNSTEWVGKSCVFEGEPACCCSNHVTRLFVKRAVANPHFLAALFNALRSTGYFGLLATNFVNQAGINTETLAAVQIPLPAAPLQDAIAAEVDRRRDEAYRLRASVAAEWDAAKARFEARLLEG